MSPQISAASIATRTARSTIRLDPADAELRCELARWALAEGRSLNIDVATAVLAARHARSARGPGSRQGWRAVEVRQVLTTVIPQLWRLHGLGVHPPLGDSMRTYLSFLDATSRLGRQGDSLTTLLDATLVADTSGPDGPTASRRGPAEVVRLSRSIRQPIPK